MLYLQCNIYIYIYIERERERVYNSVGVGKKRLYNLQILQTDIRGKNSTKKENTKNARAT